MLLDYNFWNDIGFLDDLKEYDKIKLANILNNALMFTRNRSNKDLFFHHVIWLPVIVRLYRRGHRNFNFAMIWEDLKKFYKDASKPANYSSFISFIIDENGQEYTDSLDMEKELIELFVDVYINEDLSIDFFAKYRMLERRRIFA